MTKIKTKISHARDEREIIAEKFMELIESARAEGIDEEYSTYMVFCIAGGGIIKNSREDFERFVNEIKQANAA